MGQDISVESDDVTHFRKMVKHTYFGNLDKLKKHMFLRSKDFQISRAAFIELCQHRIGKCESIIDSIKHEEAMEKHIKEKMEFFEAIEEGRICLGDTLLHMAVRLGHEHIVDYLLELHLREDIPNFKGYTVIECCSTQALRIVIEDITYMHEFLGFDHEEGEKAVKLIKVIRRIWPFWMFDSWEAGILLRVIYAARSSHPLFSKLLKVFNHATQRYKNYVTREGLTIATNLLIQAEGRAFMAKETYNSWERNEKLTCMSKIFTKIFIEWKEQTDYELCNAYLRFFDTAMEGWLDFAEELRLYTDFILPKDDVINRNEELIWAYRMHPPSDLVEDICAHIDGLQNYINLKNLKV